MLLGSRKDLPEFLATVGCPVAYCQMFLVSFCFRFNCRQRGFSSLDFVRSSAMWSNSLSRAGVNHASEWECSQLKDPEDGKQMPRSVFCRPSKETELLDLSI